MLQRGDCCGDVAVLFCSSDRWWHRVLWDIKMEESLEKSPLYINPLNIEMYSEWTAKSKVVNYSEKK